MIGGIIGDVVGSIYEFHNLKQKEFELLAPRCQFTDDTVLTVATAAALLSDRDFGRHYLEHARRHPHRGYGAMFRDWMSAPRPVPYGSYGNGAAMRVGPVAYAADDLETVLSLAAASAAVTHNHPEGIRGAQATAFAIFAARTGATPVELRLELGARFGYDLRRSVDAIRPGNRFDETCQVTVPIALTCALEGSSFEDAIRNAVSVGGDTDTIACIAGSFAEAIFGVPAELEDRIARYLAPEFITTIELFRARFPKERRSE